MCWTVVCEGFIASRTVNILNKQNATIITQLKTKIII